MHNRKNTKSNLLFLFAFLIGIAIYIKNAWVSEDAYILFRSLEQLFTGNGPVWNPHERVQVFTSPLWYVILTIPRIFSSDVYLNAIILSFLLWILTIFILKQIFVNNNILLLSILLLTASTAFFDYTSSGLENILAYCLIAMYFYNYFIIPRYKINQQYQVKYFRAIKYCLILFGFIICVRHDLALLLLIPTVYVITSNSDIISPKKWIIWIIGSLLPLFIYTLFSLIYYGFPFPNSAYAKLNTSIANYEIFKHGVLYFFSSLKYDLITILVIFGSLLFIFFKLKEYKYRAIGYGLMFSLLYIICIGGDFMQGRFLSYSYFISILTILYSQRNILSKNTRYILYSALTIYLILYPHTPFTSPLNYSNQNYYRGIADERGYYFNELSLAAYLSQINEERIFPQHYLAERGRKFKSSPENIIVQKSVGLFGYCSGTEKIIIDPLGITDPFLSRLPVSGRWRIGHFPREIPDGYIENIINKSESLTNPETNLLNNRIKLITQSSKIFSKERLIEIFLINLGK